MKKRIVIAVLVAVGVFLVWGAHAALRAHSKRVTLNVRNADVRDVIRQVEWQTWEFIFVQKGVTGKITLNVHNIPLEQALDMIGEQASSRWTAVFPLYSSGKSLAAFKQALRGDINPVDHGWSNYVARAIVPGFGAGGYGGFGNNLRGQDTPISLRFNFQDLDIATAALGHYGQAKIVPEDGATGKILLTLDRVPLSRAVAQLAHQVQRKWTKYYVLQGGRGGSGGPGRGGPGAPAGVFAGSPRPSTAEMSAEAQDRYDQLLETLPPDERAKAEEARQRQQDLRNLTPEQRQQWLAQRAADPAFQSQMQNRMLRGLLDSTPEQRVERTQRRIQRAARRGV
jgi:hypothetical protein